LVAEAYPQATLWFDGMVYSQKIPRPQAFSYTATRYNLGGVPFYYIFRDLPVINLQRILSNVGTALIFSTTTLTSLLLMTHTSLMAPFIVMWNGILWSCKKLGIATWALCKKAWESLRSIKITIPKFRFKKKIPLNTSNDIAIDTFEEEEYDDLPLEEEPIPEPPKSAITATLPTQKVENVDVVEDEESKEYDYSNYKLPPISLISDAKKGDQSVLKKGLRQQAEVLEETMLSFGIEAKVGQINCGPTITSFEVHPAVGVKVQKIKALANDIALNLRARSIRIIAPIPGKAAVGIEIPNASPQEVSFKDMLAAYRQQSKKAKIPLLLGKSVSGASINSDLTKMPHLIIAGATGSGKSVCMNGIIMTILMNFKPDEIKLVMIDPKKIELTPYSNIPHMVAPVITEPHEACTALKWMVKEMEWRYEVFRQVGVRNLASFNHRPANAEFEDSLEITIPKKMHYIVCIIDELADLMMISSNDIEMPIARLAQMARAVGIHVIIATQRPSREIITGLIKANFPAKIAFKVASRINSQIILDETGAEALLGNGDMLFLPPDTSALTRAQGPLVHDEDIAKVIEFVTKQAPTNYLIKSFKEKASHFTEALLSSNDAELDSLYYDAVETVKAAGTASTTFLQRKLKIGYARAASLMDVMEENNIVGPADGSRPRKVLANVLADSGVEESVEKE
ncbi:MAG: DNA translocase FtsK, partial [Waddliaceae bacterium]|nr:DNA translocase FtsK [Waddliaceae bacterium]